MAGFRDSVALVVAGTLVSATASGQQCDQLVAWGSNTYGGMNNIPTNPIIAVSANYHLGVGVDSAGQIHCWGAPDIRGSIPAVKGVVQVAAGSNWALARDFNGSIIAWGDSSRGQCDVPPGSYSGMDCGDWHAVALTIDGAVRCWGDNATGACNAPAGVFTAIGAGSWHSLAITPSGGVVGWGYDFGQLNAPAGVEFKQVVGGWKHSLGLSVSGSIHGWGLDIGGGLAQIPQTGTYVSIDCSASRGIALRSDGFVVAWGSPSNAEQPVPEGRFKAISAGYTIEAGVRCVCQGDLVSDGVVNAADMAVVLNFWGTSGSQFPGVDLNSDGIVNAADLSQLLNSWGACPE